MRSPKQKMYVERRKFTRLAIPMEIRWGYHSKKLSTVGATAHDVSGGGLCLILDHPIKVGTRLKTALIFPSERRPVTAVSRVMWVHPLHQHGKERFKMGLKYLKIEREDRQRFTFLFCEMMMNYFVLGGGGRGR